MAKVKLPPPPWDAAGSAAENARVALPKLAADFVLAGRAVLEKPSGKRLHSLRLAAKRLRYTLEFFEPVYGPGIGRRLSEMKQVQTFLGDINDCEATLELLEECHIEAPGFRRFLKTRIRELVEQFDRHWVEVFDRRGRRSVWRRYLAARRDAVLKSE